LAEPRANFEWYVFEFWGNSVANARYQRYAPVSLLPGEFSPPFTRAETGAVFLSAGAAEAMETASITEIPDGPGQDMDSRESQLREKPPALFGGV